MANKFSHPSEYQKKKNRVPISARLDRDIKTELSNAAKSAGLTFGELIENVLEEYSNYLKSNPAKARRK